MKNIEKILSDAGIEMTEDQKATIKKEVSENYRTISDYEKQVKKTEDAEADRDDWKKQFDDAQEKIKGFDGVNVEELNKQIEQLKADAETAKADAEKRITERDQRDYLNAEFDRLNITSERTRKSLMADIMGEDGLKWKDGSYMGLKDYLAKENEKDHFYKTEEEAHLEEQQSKAENNAPKFTDKAETKKEPAKEVKKVPVVF